MKDWTWDERLGFVFLIAFTVGSYAFAFWLLSQP